MILGSFKFNLIFVLIQNYFSLAQQIITKCKFPQNTAWNWNTLKIGTKNSFQGSRILNNLRTQVESLVITGRSASKTAFLDSSSEIWADNKLSSSFECSLWKLMHSCSCWISRDIFSFFWQTNSSSHNKSDDFLFLLLSDFGAERNCNDCFISVHQYLLSVFEIMFD